MPERREPREEADEAGAYNVAPPVMPPAPAGAGAETGGEAAASRRRAGLPPELARRPAHRAGEPTPGREPFLGYDGLDRDGVLDWIAAADPEPDQLRAILAYERTHRNRKAITAECIERLRRLGAPPTS